MNTLWGKGYSKILATLVMELLNEIYYKSRQRASGINQADGALCTRKIVIPTVCIFIFTKVLERYVERLRDNFGDVLDEKKLEWVFTKMYGNLKV